MALTSDERDKVVKGREKAKKQLDEKSEQQKVVNGSYKSFLKSPAGKDFYEVAKKQSADYMEAAKTRQGMKVDPNDPSKLVSVQLSDSEVMGMVDKASAVDGMLQYIERRASR